MKSIFERYPDMQVYYETSDGVKFFKEEDARLHARSLKDKNVKAVTRPAQLQKKTTVRDDGTSCEKGDETSGTGNGTQSGKDDKTSGAGTQSGKDKQTSKKSVQSTKNKK